MLLFAVFITSLTLKIKLPH